MRLIPHIIYTMAKWDLNSQLCIGPQDHINFLHYTKLAHTHINIRTTLFNKLLFILETLPCNEQYNKQMMASKRAALILGIMIMSWRSQHNNKTILYRSYPTGAPVHMPRQRSCCGRVNGVVTCGAIYCARHYIIIIV